MFLSVIIPVYNAEYFLERCVRSVLNQGLSSGDYEIILIDDESTDNSWNLCKDLLEKNPDIIRIFTKKNEGVSLTRQFGIEQAKGEFIAFCDADDYLLPGGYKYLLDNFLKDKDVDVLSFYSKTVLEKDYEAEISSPKYGGRIVYDGTGLDFYRSRCHTFVWNHLYRRAYIMENKIRFQPHRIGEDAMFNLELAMTNPKMRVVSVDIYRYEHHPTSIIHNRNPFFLREAVHDYVDLLSMIKRYSKEFTEKDPALSKGLDLYMNRQMMPFLSRVFSSDYKGKDFYKLRKTLKDNFVLPLEIFSVKDRLLAWIFNTPYFFSIYKWGFKQIIMKYVYEKMNRRK